MHGTVHSRLSRLFAGILAFCLPWLGCIPNPPLNAIAGVPQVQQVQLVTVPGGLVNTAGGNLFVRRVDLTIDTILGRHEIAAVYNAASGRWLWNFQMAYTGSHFLDPTGFLWVAPPAGTAFPGSVWVKVDEDTLKTKGGKAFHFDAAGKLAYVAWATLDYPRLVFSSSGIDQCVAPDVCTSVFAFSLNGSGQPLSVTDARTGRMATFSYDGLGRLVTARDALDNAENRPGFAYEYSTAGTLLTAITNSEGERVEYSYQGERRILFVTQIGEGDPRHRFDFYGYSPQSQSWPAVHTNSLGGQTRYEFDGSRRLQRITREATGETTAFTYGTTVRPTAVKTPDGATTAFSYSDDDPTMVVEASGNVVTIEYEPNGLDFDDPLARPFRRVADSIGLVAQRTFDASGRVLTASNGESETTTFSYTGVLRDSITGPNGVGATFPVFGVHGHWLDVEGAAPDHRAFDPVGNLLVSSVVGERGGILSRGFDADRNVIAFDMAATDPSGHVTSTAEVSISRRSDGRATFVARPGGGDHALDHDALGRPIAMRERVDGTWQITTFAYDAAGNLTARERPNGMREEFDRDVYGRVTAHRALRDGALEGEARYSYAWGHRIGYFDSVRGTTQAFFYDAAGRPAMFTYGHGETITFEHDLRSRVTGERFDLPGVGTVVDLGYAYDLANRQVAVTDRLLQESLVARTFGAGRLIQTVTGNGLVRTRSYDPATGNLIAMTTTDAAGIEIETTDVTYTAELDPPRQQIRSITDTPLAVTEEEYWLGLPGALSSPEGRVGKRVFGWNDGNGGSDVFAYDELGNRASDSSGNAFVYNAERNRLLSATFADGTSLDYGYDAAGFVISRGGVPLGWTATGSLASHGGDTLVWDIEGRLVSATIGGQTREFGWFGGRVQGDPAAGSVGSLDLGDVSLDLATGARLYRHLDFRKNVSFVSDDEGNLVDHYRYRPYGVDAAFGTGQNARTWDQQMSLGPFLLLGLRIYDPTVGRFLTPDLYVQANNQFTYTSGNPVGFADASGRFEVSRETAEKGTGAAVVGLFTIAAAISPEPVSKTTAAAYAAANAHAITGFADSLAKDNGFESAVDALGSTVPEISLPVFCGLLGIEPLPILLLIAMKRRRNRSHLAR